MPFPVIPVIMAVSAIANSIIQNRNSKRNAQRTADANKALADQEFSHNKEMMEYQNQYNDPSAQMRRLSSAGLNPNMVYGSGSAANQAAPAARYNAPKVDLSYSPVQIPEFLGMYQQFEAKQAQIDNVKAQTANTHQKTMTEAVTRYVKELQGRTGDFDLERRQYLAPYEAAITGSKARASEATMQQEWSKLRQMNQQEVQQLLDADYKRKTSKAVDLDNEKRQAEIMFLKYRNQLAKEGINSSDHILLRLLVRMMNDTGFSGDLGSILKK